jgi:hypothetical protein
MNLLIPLIYVISADLACVFRQCNVINKCPSIILKALRTGLLVNPYIYLYSLYSHYPTISDDPPSDVTRNF